jgi:hypothetical protein
MSRAVTSPHRRLERVSCTTSASSAPEAKDLLRSGKISRCDTPQRRLSAFQVPLAEVPQYRRSPRTLKTFRAFLFCFCE